MRIYDLEQRTIGRILAEKAERLGDKQWLLWNDQRHSYAELEEITNRYANGFRTRGVRQGDHAAVLLPNGPEFLWVIWALGKIGAVAVPLNTAAKGGLLHYYLDQSDSAWVIVAEEWAERITALAGRLPKLKGAFHFGTCSVSDSALAGLSLQVADLREMVLGSAEPPPVDAVRHSDLHLIMYTSGTTGPSKGVMSPHSQGHAIGHHLAEHFRYGPGDVLYTCLPIFHANALWYTCYAALWADATVALSPHFSASRFWHEIKLCGATQFNTLSAMTTILWKRPPSDGDQDHSLRQCMAVPVPKEIYREFQDRYHVGLNSWYAATETFAVTLLTSADPPAKAGSAGRTRGYAEVQIVDDAGRALSAGGIGEICVRPLEPGMMMSGYYKMPDATLAAQRDLWFHTGDRGYLDEDGYLYFVDRIKDAIRRRGENISAYDLEAIIGMHPAISEVAAIAVASELGEDEVMVFLVRTPGMDISAEALIEFCTQNMATFMVPRFVEFVADLPKTASNKVEKYKLKEIAAVRRSVLWDREAAAILASAARSWSAPSHRAAVHGSITPAHPRKA